jgi:O-antigen/teichoic acid export membrane protein
MAETNNIPEDLKKRVIQGGGALTSARLLNRTFGLIRMLTIARWLGPAEMGVYAVATLVITAVEQFTETGLRPALIQRPGDISPYIIPVRTVQAVRGLVLGLVILLSAPWVAELFSSPRSLSILRVIAILPIIRGFEPLFETLMRKELRFAPVVTIQVVASLISLFIGLTAAYFRPDAWALVWASLSEVIVITIGTNILSDYRNIGFSFGWQPLKDIRNFGFWIQLTSIISYISLRGGGWMIGYLLGLKELALYQSHLIKG